MSAKRRIDMLVTALLALAAIGWAVWSMSRATDGLEVTAARVGTTPVTVHRLEGSGPVPAVVIAHGFAGSRQLMAPFANTLAQSGYVAVSFDFLGHGRNPSPMTGDVTREDGATQALVSELLRVVEYARTLPGTTGEVAILGHSMASDIVIRGAIRDGDVAATIAVSMFSRAVTAQEPRNLLMIVGGWEDFLAGEALRVLREGFGPEAVTEKTYGRFADGSARMVVLSDSVEHVGVLYSRESLVSARNWLNGVFGRGEAGPVDVRGGAIALLIAGVLALAWPLSALLPRIPRTGNQRRVSTRWFLAAAILPGVVTPLALWPMPTGFLPVLVADYLAIHFALYGALTAGMLWRAGQLRAGLPGERFWLAAGLATLYVVGAMGWALDSYVASFVPGPGRFAIIAVLSVGTLAYTLADAWLVRAPGAPPWGALLTRVMVLLSLGLAVALDLENLFFLLIILPVIVLFFLIYGLFARWINRAAEHPGVAGISVGLAFGWALGVTFPLFG